MEGKDGRKEGSVVGLFNQTPSSLASTPELSNQKLEGDKTLARCIGRAGFGRSIGWLVGWLG